MKIVDIETAKKAKSAERRRKRKAANRPDQKLIYKEPDGTEWFTYSIRYAYKGSNYTLDIKATSEKDAWGRLYAMRTFPVEINQISSSIPY